MTPLLEYGEIEELVEALGIAQMRSQRTLDVMMAEHGISSSRHRLLSYIKSHGPVRSADISAHFGFAPRTVTDAIDVLERAEMVVRNPDSADRRAKWISITQAGEAVIASTEAQRRSCLSQFFGRLDSGERHALLTALNKLGATA